LAVLIVPTTQPEPIEAYSIRVAEAWKIGRKGQDNGVLLVVAKDDRKVRLEVGYGYEGSLTDATSRRIIAETISPFFRQGQFAAGIGAGVDRVSSVIAKGEPAPPAPQGRPVPQRGIDPAMIFLLLFIVVPVLGGILRRLFGKVGGATVGAGIVGAVAWGISGVLLIAIAAAVISWFVMLLFSMGGGGTVIRNGSVVRRGPYIGGGFPGGWGGGGGGGWGGGGGGFGGGGASGDW
jgi:uncharacterized protein